MVPIATRSDAAVDHRCRGRRSGPTEGRRSVSVAPIKQRRSSIRKARNATSQRIAASASMMSGSATRARRGLVDATIGVSTTGGRLRGAAYLLGRNRCISWSARSSHASIVRDPSLPDAGLDRVPSVGDAPTGRVSTTPMCCLSRNATIFPGHKADTVKKWCHPDGREKPRTRRMVAWWPEAGNSHPHRMMRCGECRRRDADPTRRAATCSSRSARLPRRGVRCGRSARRLG
jgi:hypothetical protein